jgi:hypothetical protein
LKLSAVTKMFHSVTLVISFCHAVYIYIYIILYCYLLQLSFHSVAVVQTRTNIHKRYNKKHRTKHNKYKYTYYENTNTYYEKWRRRRISEESLHDCVYFRSDTVILSGISTFLPLATRMREDSFLHVVLHHLGITVMGKTSVCCFPPSAMKLSAF